MYRKCMQLFVVYINFIPLLMGFNLDINFPIVYNDPTGGKSYFGFSVILQPSGENEFETYPWIQIGAPRGTIRNNMTGLVFRCPIEGPCYELKLSSKCPGIHDDWVGVAMDVQYVDKPGKVVVCGHRWRKDWRYAGLGTYLASGVCYVIPPTGTTTNARGGESCLHPLDELGRKAKSNVYVWELAQGGMSVHFSQQDNTQQKGPELLFGAPGVHNWQGNVVQYGPNSFLNSKYFPNLLPDAHKVCEGKHNFDLLGYQVSSGHFFSKGNLIYVASGPRSGMYLGCVILFTLTPNIKVEAKVTGRQLGEYFGASLAVGDFDNDGYDDLVVGAPQHTRVRDEGCIYTFYGQKDGRVLMIPQQNEISQITGVVSGSRFGTSMISLGDLDNDGYADLAVGAPYEDGNRGAVYIYNGRHGGLNTKYSQRILAKQVDNGLRGFGISISKASDIDKNNYKDVAIGSYLSGQAVLFRAHPVVKLGQTLSAIQTKVKAGSTRFTITACLNYNGSYVPKQIRVKRTLTVDNTFKRAYWHTSINASNFLEEHIFLNKTERFCEDLIVILEPNKTQMYSEIRNPIEIRLNHQLAEDHSKITEVIWINSSTNGARDGFCKTCPVVAQEQTINEETLNIALAVDCTDEICNADLTLDCQFPKLRGTTFVIGSSKYIELLLEVENKGESAYETKLIVHIPLPVQLYRVPSGCDAQQDGNNYIIVDCDIDNKFNAGTKKSISLELDMSDDFSSQVRDSIDLKFYANVLTQSEEENDSDNSCQFNLTLSSEADITIVGKSRNQDTYAFTHADTLSNRSIEFVHDYEVQKFGDSPIEQALIELKFPTEWTENSAINFLRIYQPEADHGNQPLTCSSNVDDQMYLKDSLADETDSIVREKRSTEKPSSEPKALQLLQANQTFFLNCSTPNVKCSTVTCVSRPFRDTSVVHLSIIMAINISRIAPLLGSKNVIHLSSQGLVKIALPLNFQQTHKFNDKPDNATVETRFIGSPPKEELANWVIPVSVGGGLLLLFLVIMTLIKAGFFERKKRLEMEALISADAEEKKEMVRRSQMMVQENSDSDPDP